MKETTMRRLLKRRENMGLGALCLAAGLLVQVFSWAGCMDPSYYEDPPPEEDLRVFQGWVPTDDALQSREVGDVEEPGDGGDVSADTTVQEGDEGDIVAGDLAQERVPDGKCYCRFELAVTSPLPQSYVWITGDFLSPPWPMTIEGGVVELILNPGKGTWAVAVLLDDADHLEYKYLVGWADNPGPIWWDQDGTQGGPNSQLLVACGLAPCD